MNPLVVKVGGSLETSGRLSPVLDLVARAQRPVVVVPGGGVFADAVRETSARHSLSDQISHRQAILAMHQMAFLMIGLQRRLVAAETLEDMAQAWSEARIPVWLPLELCKDDPSVPEDWTITSDGIAARLAERLGGAPLVLVKSRRVDPAATAAALAREGIVDAAFPAIVARAGLDWRILGPGEEGELAGLLEAPVSPALTAGAV